MVCFVYHFVLQTCTRNYVTIFMEILPKLIENSANFGFTPFYTSYLFLPSQLRIFDLGGGAVSWDKCTCPAGMLMAGDPHVHLSPPPPRPPESPRHQADFWPLEPMLAVNFLKGQKVIRVLFRKYYNAVGMRRFKIFL